MPIESPNLDDLRFSTVRDLLIRQIPIVAPEWTDHNDSDPGVAMIQLFAYLAEQIGYRLNRIPEKNYLEFLKLIGIQLRPAEPARTLLDFILAKAETSSAFLVPAGTRVKATSGGGAAGPPTFETDAELDAVPAQLCALVTTASNDLRQLRVDGEAEPGASVDSADYIAQRYTLVWNGKVPKLKDMPAQPVPVFAALTDPAQEHLWIGLAFNRSPAAGFLGQRVTLTVQMDDDEQPSSLDEFQCGTEEAELTQPDDPNAPRALYQYYRPVPDADAPDAPSLTMNGTAGKATWRYRIVGERSDGTLTAPSREASTDKGADKLNDKDSITLKWVDAPDVVKVHVYRTVSGGEPRSTGRIATLVAGVERLVDTGLAGDGNRPPLGAWRELLPVSDTTDSWTRSGRLRFDVPSDMGPIPDEEWQTVRAAKALTTKELCDQATKSAVPPPPELAHPLKGALKVPVIDAPTQVPVSGWLHVAFPGPVPKFKLRTLSFNVTAATHATTVRSELLQKGNGLPGQQVNLAHGNLLAGTLQLAVTDAGDQLLHIWQEVEDFDASEPVATHYLLDREAGIVTFGDGVRGRPPGEQARIVALTYRFGGGKAAEVPVATISKPESVPAAVQEVTNPIAAQGGKDAETLDEAKARAPKQLKVLGRAVTNEDFQFLAKQTPGLRVARAEVAALRRPYRAGDPAGPGLNLDVEAAGALSLVVVPDQAGLYPTPTLGMLRRVCEFLDKYRLVTTELHVVPPQYVRLFQVKVHVKARAGFSRTLLRESIATRLEQRFHVLTGGADGKGYPFGATLHHADVVAEVLRVDGVERVEEVIALFDGQTPKNAPIPMTWRKNRQTFGTLTNCPSQEGDVVSIALAADENVFVDSSDLEVSVV